MTALTAWSWEVRSVKFFPGCRHYFFQPIQRRNSGSKSPTQRFFRSQLTEKACLPQFHEHKTREGLLAALARTQAASAGAPDLFHVVDVLQMCCLSRRGGAVQIVKGKQSGIVFLRDGAIVTRKRRRHAAKKRCLKSSHGNLSNLLTTVPSLVRLRQSRCLVTWG